MTNTRVLRFDLLSYWHAGTGRGDGDLADAVVQRSRSGLPYLPGRTVKGLLRAVAAIGVEAELLDAAESEAWFGSRLIDDGADRVRSLEQARFTTKPGALRFSSATLGSDWEGWAAALPPKDPQRDPLFTLLASTRIDDSGVASDRTLRTIEVAVPMTLRATVEGPDDGRWPQALTAVAPFLRTLGSGRNRGLGRVCLTVEAT